MISSSLLKNYSKIKHISGSEKEFFALISTDSRKFQAGMIFIALEGERFDGFDYVQKIAAKGASAIVYRYSDERRQELKSITTECLLIGVDDTLSFLQELARQRIRKWKEQSKGKVIAITGSNGKTTTKEMLYELMNAGLPGKVHCTQGNFNNHIGLPLTLLAVSDHHHYVIAEMGTNHPGEIEVLCQIAEPDIGMITNIGSSHLEFFHNEKNVFVEKSDLYRNIQKRGGVFFINQDDTFLNNLEGGIGYGKRGRDYKIEISGHGFCLSGRVSTEVSNKNIIGDYNKYNLAVSYIIATHLLGECDELAKAAEFFEPRGNRSLLVEKDDSLIFLDAYNANPSSMKAAVSSFASLCRERSICLDKALIILGDMNELGEKAALAHRAMGELLADLGFSNAIFVGKFAKEYEQGFNNKCQLYSTADEIDISNELSLYLALFIKGSRSLKLETLVDMS